MPSPAVCCPPHPRAPGELPLGNCLQQCYQIMHTMHTPLRRYPLQDARLLQRLAALLSQLAHWCPLFSEVSFLPSVAFPLLKVFRPGAAAATAAGGTPAAASAAFEAAATLLANWGRHWFVTFPHPPLGLLQRFEGLLAIHDSELAAHCSRWQGGAGAVAWELMSTLMTDVLDRSEWLQVLPPYPTALFVKTWPPVRPLLCNVCLCVAATTHGI